MKVIDAFWEKRNLGVDTVEFNIENNDTEEVINDILKAEKQYNVVKLPVNKPELMQKLQDNGYCFVECMLNLTHDLSEPRINIAKNTRRFETTCLPMDDKDVAELFKEIDNGMFNSDRVYNDSFFSKEAAALRYKNWISDEMEKGSVAYKVVFRNATVGFFILKKMEKHIANPFLIGIYKKYSNGGFGISLAYNILFECLNQGIKKISGYVSSNNPAIIRVDELLGYAVNHVEYVFIKHK